MTRIDTIVPAESQERLLRTGHRAAIRRLCGLVGALVLGALAPNNGREPAADAQAALRLMVSTPFVEAGSLEIVSRENSAAGGETYVSWISRRNNVWLLRQRSETSAWLRYGLVVANGRAYWATLDGIPQLCGEACASCHANGPRALDGELIKGTVADLRRFNVEVASLGLVRPAYPPHDPPHDQRPFTARACAKCHDGVHRAALTRDNAFTINFRVERGTMPPDEVLTAAEHAGIAKWLAELAPKPIDRRQHPGK